VLALASEVGNIREAFNDHVGNINQMKNSALKSCLVAGLAGCAIFVSGCVSHYAHSVSASTSTQGAPVTAEASGTGILMLTVPDLDASDDLKAKCPSGKLSNVETQASVRNWFGIVQSYSVEVHGICNQ
jgi:hypothetical protein